MAGSQQGQLTDHWRPEASSTSNRAGNPRKSERSRSRECGRSAASPPPTRNPDRHSSPPPKANHFNRSQNVTSSRPHSRSSRRSRSRPRYRGRSPASPPHPQDDEYRPRRRNDSRSSLKRRRSISRSSAREDFYRPKRRRSRSIQRSISRSRRPDASRRITTERAFSPRASLAPRHASPDSYVPSSRRPRSPEFSYYRPAQRSSPSRRRYSSRDQSRSRSRSPRRYIRRDSPAVEQKRRSNNSDIFESRLRKDERRPEQGPSRGRTRSRSPRRRSRERSSLSRPRQASNKERASPSRRRSPTPIRRRENSVSQERHREKGDGKMRNSYPSHSRPPARNFSNSPQYSSNNHTSTGQAQYGGRGAWNGSHQGSPTHGFSPNQSPYPNSSVQNHTQFYANQQYSASPAHSQQGNPMRGGAHSSAGRGRGGTPMAFQNLSWTPQTGSRGGRAPIDKTRSIAAPVAAQIELQGSAAEDETENPFRPSLDMRAEEETDNPFRPSKDLRVEDSSTTTDSKPAMSTPSQSAATATSSPSGPKISFALKTKPLSQPAAVPKTDLSLKARDVLSTSRAKLSSSTRSEDDSRYDRRRDPSPDRKDDYRRDDRTNERRDYRRDDRGRQADAWSDRDRRDDRFDDRRRYDDRRDDRRDIGRDDLRGDRGFSDLRRRVPDARPEQRTEPRAMRPPPIAPVAPKVRMVTVVKKRPKPRPTLPAEFATSDSVYFRKPGNESVVGSGTYGKVFKGVHVYTKDMVALKKIRMEGEKDGFPVTAIREIKLLQSLNHENIVKLREVMVEKNDCFMVFEYLSHDLTGLLNHPTFVLDDAQKKDLGRQMFDGLNYLHNRGVLHRDIKAANILVSNTGVLKLADFGLARFYAKRKDLDYTNRVITIWYRSPELLLGETQYGPSVDIWSAACVLVEIFTQAAIFPGDGTEINQLDRIYQVLGTPTLSIWPAIKDMQWFELLRPTHKRHSTFAEKYKHLCTPAAFELLEAMFQYDPANRPSAADVLEHPYFSVEDPRPRQPKELEQLEGDWHEFESKALRRENQKAERDARRAAKEKEAAKKGAEAEKRRAEETLEGEREAKRTKQEEQDDLVISPPPA